MSYRLMASDATEGEQPRLGKCGGAVRIAGLCCAVLLQKRTRARAKRTKGVLVGVVLQGCPAQHLCTYVTY